MPDSAALIVLAFTVIESIEIKLIPRAASSLPSVVLSFVHELLSEFPGTCRTGITFSMKSELSGGNLVMSSYEIKP